MEKWRGYKIEKILTHVNQFLGHWLMNYKKKYFFENCVFYFLKLEKLLLLMLTLFFLSILRSPSLLHLGLWMQDTWHKNIQRLRLNIIKKTQKT